MSNVTIGDLATTEITTATLVEVEEGGVSGKATIGDIRNLLMSLMVRQTVQITAAAGGVPVLDRAVMGQLAVVLSVQADQPCRLRLYATQAERNADQSRPVITDPGAGAGCLYEVSLTADLLSMNAAPIPLVQNNENPIGNQIAFTLEPQTELETTVVLTYMVVKA